MALQKSIDFDNLERSVLPAGTGQLRKGVFLARNEQLHVSNCFEQGRLAAPICSEEQLLLRGPVLKIDEAPEVVNVDASQHDSSYTERAWASKV